MAEKIESFFTTLDFKFNPMQLMKFNNLVEQGIKSLAMMLAGAGAAVGGAFLFTKEIAETSDTLGKFALRLGMSVDAIQELDYVAQLNGASTSDMRSSLEALTKTAAEASRGIGGGVEAFGMLGVSVTGANGKLKQTDQIFTEVSNAVNQLDSQAQKLELMSKLGISSDLLLTMDQTTQALIDQRKAASEYGMILSKKDVDLAARFNDALLNINTIIGGIANFIGTSFMADFAPFMEAMARWYKGNKEIIKQNIAGFIKKITSSAKIFTNIGRRVVFVVDGIVQKMGGWKTTLMIISGLIMTLNARALLLPALAVAAIAGLGLIIEDLYKYTQGHDTVIGALTTKYAGLKTIVDGFLSLIKTSLEGWILIFTQSGDALEGMLFMFQEIGESIQMFLIEKIRFFIGLLNKIPGVQIDLFEKTEYEKNIDKIKKKSMAIPYQNTGVEKITEESPLITTLKNVYEPQTPLTGFVPSPIMMTASGGNEPINKTVNVYVQGGDAQQVKKTVLNALDERFKDARTVYNTGN